ncbi:hypothetical protein HO173_006353 [Letharia columbiana]|uniref:MPN domain-containing protein n=1 Tax=Letharia columbiana TaxID=112416 RepID=A0A8H6L4V5_9LECA|nr:uncharacterized protein HO173_006353 [Letharia columbiana]KAF6235670.1 hypothetical protein HO173_006353 [Letharia columbiana]
MAPRTIEETGPSRPLNVEQIVKKAQNFDYNPLIPLKYWLRTAGTLLKEAEIYEHEGNDQQTYLLLFRHAQLVIRNLSTHPDARQGKNRLALAQANKDVDHGLMKLEVLKPRINKRYERYEQLLHDRDTRRASASAREASRSREQKALSNQQVPSQRPISDPPADSDTETLAAGENRDLAVKLAHKEIRRRATARKATRQAGISEEVEHERRTAGVWGNWEEAFTKNDESIDQDTLSRQMQNVRLQVSGSTSAETRNGSSRPSFESQKSNYHYPAVPEHRDSGSWKPSPQVSSSLDDYSLRSTPTSLGAPELPPKDYDADRPRNQNALPLRPEKEALSASSTLFNLDQNPAPQQDLKPSTFTFKPSAYLESGTPLRTIFLPPDLRHRFLSIALPNTRANLETCGILCGTLVSNALFISKLVIPDQESTSDTCETINESQLFDYVDGEDLMVLGWIHTHPTQTCFMSSRDLHTHGGYQVMMPESIAIVCAPSKGDWGVFRLTDPPGMKTVLNCTQTGLFHPHAESNIYTDALRPGHVYEAKGLEFDVVDLRPH